MSARNPATYTRRTIFSFATAATGAIFLASCAAGGGANADGTVTITVMGKASELSEDQIAAFEKDNPKIKVEFIEYDQSRLSAMLAAGESLEFVSQSPSINLFAKGLAEPLDDYIADSKVIAEDDLLPVNGNWQWDGKTTSAGSRYGLVKDWSPDFTVWFNKDLFAQAGVEPLSTTEPVTWDELLETAIALKAGGVEMPLGLEWQWSVESKIRTMIIQQGGQQFSDDLSEVYFTTPEAKRAFQWFVDYAKADVGPTSLNPLADGSDVGVFTAERMAMTLDGYWFGANFAKPEHAALQDKIAMAPAPTFGGERVDPSANGGIGAFMPSSSKYKDEAWIFFEYFFAGQPALDRAASGWGFPSLQSLVEYLPAELPYQQQAIETAQAEVPFSEGSPYTPYLAGTQINDALNRELQAVIKGEKSVDDALKTIEDEINGEIAKGKDQLG